MEVKDLHTYAVGTGQFLVHNRKEDIEFIDYVQKELEMSNEQRELLHDEISGMNFTQKEIWKIAEQIIEDYPNK